MESSGLFNIFVFLAASCLVVPLASRFKLGAVLGYLCAGVLIGPFGLRLIANPQEILHIAEFGVVMMLFVIGLELEPKVLWRMKKAMLGLGGMQICITTGLFTALGMGAGYSWQASLAVGMALALSSTALVLQLLQERNLTHTFAGEISIAVLLFQDIAVIPILVIMPILSPEGSAALPVQHNWLTGLPGWAHAMAVAGVIGCVILIGRYLSYYVFDIIAKTNLREVFTATSLMLVVGITLLMQLIGVSPALGAFVAGVVLANSEYKHTLETDIEPFKSLLLGLFFISVGMGMDFGLFRQEPLSLIGAVLTLMAVKASVLFVLGRLFGMSPRYNIGFALALSQGGEFGFVLFQFAGGLAILSPSQSAFLTLAVALSIALTPLVMLAYTRFVVPRFMSILPESAYDNFSEHNTVILAGYGRVGQIIGRFLVAQGVKVTILEKDPEQIATLRKFGFKGHFGDATRTDLMRSAHASEAKMLIVAVDDPDAALEIVRMARREFPNLLIYARARNRRHAYDLNKEGAHYFKRETFDSSLTMAKAVMVALGRRPEEVEIKARQFQEHDEAALLKSFEFFDNEPELVNFSRFNAEELENILQNDSTVEKIKESA